MRSILLRPSAFVVWLLLTALAAAQEKAPTAIARTQWEGREAYQITDGKTEAIVVPALARVMRFGTVGGKNWLWRPPAGQEMQGAWKNFGGEKAWVAPQGQWLAYLGHGFPPDPAWESDFQAEVRQAPVRLSMAGQAGKCGVRISREFSFAANGDFVAETTLHKTGPAPILAAGWTVTQIAAPSAVFLPANEKSPYQGGLYRWPPHTNGDVARVAPSLLRVKPTTAGGYKLGVDAAVGAIAAVQGREALVQRADPGRGDYPDGADGAGFSAELYDHGLAERHYLELELLSPLSTLTEGQSSTFTVRWSLRTLVSEQLDAPELLKQISGFLLTPP